MGYLHAWASDVFEWFTGFWGPWALGDLILAIFLHWCSMIAYSKRQNSSTYTKEYFCLLLYDTNAKKKWPI